MGFDTNTIKINGTEYFINEVGASMISNWHKYASDASALIVSPYILILSLVCSGPEQPCLDLRVSDRVHDGLQWIWKCEEQAIPPGLQQVRYKQVLNR